MGVHFPSIFPLLVHEPLIVGVHSLLKNGCPGFPGFIYDAGLNQRCYSESPLISMTVPEQDSIEFRLPLPLACKKEISAIAIQM